MPSVTVSAPSLVRSTSADAETPFTAAQARRFPVPAFKVAYASPGNYNDDTVVLSQLQTLKVFVAYTPLTGAPGAGADYSSWFVTKVEGEYQSSYTGSLAVLSATFPEQVEIPLLLAVEVHDAAEPDRLVLPDFEGPVQMLYGCVGPGSRGRAAPCVSPRDPPTASALTCGCRSSRLRSHRIIIGGLGFLSSFFYFPWLFCKVYKNALHNNGQPPLFYRSSRAFRGW